MASRATLRDAAEQRQPATVGTFNVVDPNPSNWLFITWNTIRPDERRYIIGTVTEGPRRMDDDPTSIQTQRPRSPPRAADSSYAATFELGETQGLASENYREGNNEE